MLNFPNKINFIKLHFLCNYSILLLALWLYNTYFCNIERNLKETMTDTSILVAGIEYKIRILIEINQNLKKENEELKNQNTIHKLALDNLTNSNQQITEQLNHKIITKSLGSETEIDESRKIIQALVREIDQCIALLNK